MFLVTVVEKVHKVNLIGNINVPIIMVAEKAADIIKRSYPRP